MKVIANPHAGRGRAAEHLRKLIRLTRNRGIGCEVLQTRGPGHGTELATQLADRGVSRVVVLGGDGTVTEVVNGILDTGMELGVISSGTGNDLARSLGLPYNDVESSLEVLMTGRPVAIDIGCEGGQRFVSVLGIGYPALVAAEANRMRWLKGSTSFFFSVYKGLRRMEALSVKMMLDDRVLELDCSSILVHNTPYTGGGLRMAPAARCDDGLFDVVVIDPIGRLDLMLNFPKVYRGRHLDHPSFSVYRSSRVRIESKTRALKMRDGDVCGSLPVDARVLPGALKVVLPA